MTIEITGVPGAPITNKQTAQAGNATDAKTASTATINTGTSTADSFVVSQQAEKLRMIESSINNQPDVDGARVESLKIAIDAGQYDVDPARVAEKLIELEMQFVA